MMNGVCSAHVVDLHLSLSILMFHPPSLLFPDGHFETTFPTLTSTTPLPSFTRPKSAGLAHFRTSAEEFGNLADPTHSTGCDPKELDKITSADGDTTPINDPNYDNISDFSKITRMNTGLFGVSTVFESSVSHVSHGESKDSMHRETVAGQRERQSDGSVISVAESMSRKSRRNSTWSHSLQTHREFYSDERDLREHLEQRAQQAIFGENSVQRKCFSTEHHMEILILERRNSEYALIESQRELQSERRQLLEANQWADQDQRERIHLCSELKMKKRLHQESYAKSCREIEELKRRCYQAENTDNQRRLEEFPTQHDQESRTVSLLRDQVRRLQERLEYTEDSKIFYDPDSPSSCDSTYVPHQALIASSSRKPGREDGMQHSLYGTRDAVQNWEEELTSTLSDLKLTRGVACPCVWRGHIKGEHVVATVHGDDITIGGERSAVELLIRKISRKYEIKKQMIGEGADFDKSGRILNRVIEWGRDGRLRRIRDTSEKY